MNFISNAVRIQLSPNEMSEMAEKWNKIGSCTIKGELAVLSGDNKIVCDKELVQNLLLKELIELIPGRYVVRETYLGKNATTIRFVKHKTCQQQWKFSASSESLLLKKASFDLYETEVKCDHVLSEIARPRPLKGLYC